MFSMIFLRISMIFPNSFSYKGSSSVQKSDVYIYMSDVRSSLIITPLPHRWASETALVISWCLLGVKTSNRGVRRGTGF